jgi:DNA invertase Pin-like site-specific DNA recombinase
LVADVVAGQDVFDTILVYDVSRWGRFQDADESAHLEFLCRSAGVRPVVEHGHAVADESTWPSSSAVMLATSS